jgi:DNA-binding NtrC family response regulator
VLVVDDEPAIRVLLERCCTLNGLQPFLAAIGAEAMEIYRREGEKIGVVLLDVRMPGMNGPDTLEALRRLNPQVRCCFMSGDPGEYTAEDLRQRGALHLFSKPLPLRELIEALQAILANPGTPC